MYEHRSLLDAELHKPGYVQSVDPGNVGPGKLWVDTSLGTGLWVLKLRNDADTGWENLALIGAVYATSLYLLNSTTAAYSQFKCRNDDDGNPLIYPV